MKAGVFALLTIAMLSATTACGSGAGATPSAALPATQGSASAQGVALFGQYCAGCHKQDGSGGVPVGAATSKDLRQPSLGPMYRGDAALLTRAVLEGKDEDGRDLDAAMPRFKGQLSESDAKAIVAYLGTLK